MIPLRRLTDLIHRYLGLLLALPLLLVSLTGGALLFRGTIETALHPDLYEVEPTGRSAELEQVREAVRTEFPDRTIRLVRLPAGPDRPIVVRFADGDRRVHVDPHRGKILGSLRPGATLTGKLHRLHTTLFAGRFGRWVLGLTGVGLVLLTLTGGLRWAFPEAGDGAFFLGGAELKGSGADRWLHRCGGVGSLLFLFVIGAAGAVLVLGGAVHLEGESGPSPRATPSSHGERVISLDAAVRMARSTWTAGRVTAVEVPVTPTDPLTVRVRASGEIHPEGLSRLHLDPYTGNVLGLTDVRGWSWDEELLAAVGPLHAGSFGGLGVRVLYLLAGFATVILTVTGCTMWGGKFRKVAPSPP